MRNTEIFTIRQMIELTGLSEFTIRGWENRYQAFSPNRTKTGRREYEKKDVERALLIRELLKRGHKISQIASLSQSKLQTLFERFEEVEQSSQDDFQHEAVKEALELMSLQKWEDLAELFTKTQAQNASDLIYDFFLPLLRGLAKQLELGRVSIAQEHILSSLLKEKIYSTLSSLPTKHKKKPSSRKVRFILAGPEGDYHEIGLLLAHLLLRSYGFTSLFLGPNTPAQDLAETALRFESSHLLIVSTVAKNQGAEHHLLNFVSHIQKKVGPRLKILLAGGQAPALTPAPDAVLLSVGSFQDFENCLQSL